MENRQKLTTFQAVPENYQACITTPKQMGIMGGSNGACCVSANMVERPDLFGASFARCRRGHDPLHANRRGASWISDTVIRRPEGARWILKYSPYQNVKADKTYPPVFFVTATSDDRVTPVHARKMAALMEAQGTMFYFMKTPMRHAAAANHKQGLKCGAKFRYLKQKLGWATQIRIEKLRPHLVRFQCNNYLNRRPIRAYLRRIRCVKNWQDYANPFYTRRNYVFDGL